LFLNLSIHFESSTAELGPGGIPTGGTFKVLKPAQAVQAASADGRYAVHAQKQAANDQRLRDMEIEQRAVNGSRLGMPRTDICLVPSAASTKQTREKWRRRDNRFDFLKLFQ
jgi:hypothetical protein